MTQPELQKILLECFYGAIDEKEAFKLINEDREKLLQEIANLKQLTIQAWFTDVEEKNKQIDYLLKKVQELNDPESSDD